MRKPLAAMIAVGLLILTGCAASPDAQTKEHTRKVVLRISQMDCGGCELAVKIAAKKVNGVREIIADSEKRVAEVTYDPAATTVKAIIDAIVKNSGFKAEEVKPRK